MLNFEDEMKAVKRGYVVLGLDEYDQLRDDLAKANMRAYEAEQLAERRIAETKQEAAETLSNVLKVYHMSFSDKYMIEFNTEAVYAIAAQLLEQYPGALDKHYIVTLEDFNVFEGTIARPKPTTEVARPIVSKVKSENMDVEDIDW